MLNLFDAVVHEVTGVTGGFLHRPIADVILFILTLAGDAMVFDTGESPDAIGMNVRFDVIEIQIKTNVPVKVPVVHVAGITFLRAPDLFRRFNIASECSHAIRRKNRRVHSVSWARMGKHDAMRIGDKPPDAGFREKVFDTRSIRAFWQPNPFRVTSKTLPVMVTRCEDLGADTLRMLHQRQKTVRRAASDDFEFSEFLKLTKCADEIATIAVTKCGTCLVKSIVVKPRKIVKRLIPFRAFDFFFGQRNQSCEMPDITLLQQRV